MLTGRNAVHPRIILGHVRTGAFEQLAELDRTVADGDHSISSAFAGNGAQTLGRQHRRHEAIACDECLTATRIDHGQHRSR